MAMPWTQGPKRLQRVAVLVLIATFIFLTLRAGAQDARSIWRAMISGDGQASRSQSKISEAPHHRPVLARPDYCDLWDTSHISFITKTGATEAKDKLPPQLSTCLSCVPDPLIFSDLDQRLGQYQIHDVLSRVTAKAIHLNSEFELYYKQKQLASQGREDEIKSLHNLLIPDPDWRTAGKTAGWALDKYKFLHMIERAWEYQPGRDWYVFIETDTYVSLPNLVAFLDTQDPTQKLYLGNAIPMWEHKDQISFAHGGSGFILSGAVVKDFAVTHKGLAAKFDGRIKDNIFGDFALADTLNEVLNVQVTNISPLLQSENPSNVPFAEHTWCRPAITLHHMSTQQFNIFFEYEKAVEFTGMLYRDLFTLTFLRGGIPSRKDEWDNGSRDEKYRIQVTPRDLEELRDDVHPTAMEDRHGSFAACELACIQMQECLQFSFHRFEEKASECLLSKAVRLGKAFDHASVDPEEFVESGWLNGRISDWVGKHRDCPD